MTEHDDERIDTLLLHSNAVRISAGRAPLQLHAVLADVAQQHAQAMAREGWFDHIDAQGRGVGARLLDAGFNYRFAGENISAGKATLQQTIDWWLQSATHRDNILKTEFTHVGFGYSFMEPDRNGFHHYWVMVMATAL